jgi:6-phosphogluconolactonase
VTLLGTLLILAAAVQTHAPKTADKATDWLVYVGTYTRGGSKGIYGYRYHGATGKLTSSGVVAEAENPTFLAIHPNQRFLYSTNQTDTHGNQLGGTLSAYAIDAATGRLTLLNRVSSHGAAPCHVSVDREGKWLFTANFTGGSVAAFPIHADGSLGDATAVHQHVAADGKDPRPHMVLAAPDNHFALAVDMGLDEVLVYRIDPVKGLAPDPAVVKVAAGTGPRHLAFGADGKFVYVLSEKRSIVTAFRYDAAHGTMTELQRLATLPDGATGENNPAEIAVSPDGRSLYTSNRGHDSIALFGVDATSGRLTLWEHAPAHGKTPRHVALDPSGSLLVTANQESGNVVLFRVETKTGGLTRTGASGTVPWPACVVFVKAKN